jgi:hypothetical protein
MNLIRSLSFLAALCLVQAAQAQPAVQFSSAASACVPDHATIRDDRAQIGNPSVRHAAGIVDPVVLTCAIPPFTSAETEWGLGITYLDSTGAGTSANVRARLYRMQLDGAAPDLLITANSNASASTMLHTLEAHFTHTFNFDTHLYWVRLELDRSAASQNVILYSVFLEVAPLSSDIRLKHNVALLGRLDNGLGFYRFSYNGSDAAYVGVMAQEVEAIMPDAVVRGSDGYLRVFYDRLGLRMQTWEEWIAAGAEIPATVPPNQR